MNLQNVYKITSTQYREFKKKGTINGIAYTEDESKLFVIEDYISSTDTYHLGVFDSVDTSSDKYDVITRQTGYLNCGNATEKGVFKSGSLKVVHLRNGSGNSGRTDVLGVINLVGYTKTDITDWNNMPNNSYSLAPDSAGKMTLSFRCDSLSDDACYLLLNTVNCAYQLANPYTETVIKNQPLNTLDQQGSQWVRREWEKTLNLFNKATITANCFINTSGALQSDSDCAASDYIEIKPNTIYTKNIPTGWDIGANGLGVAFYNSSKTFISGIAVSGSNFNTFITPSTAKYMRFCWISNSSYPTVYISVDNIMLNEGNHTYPYQPYHMAEAGDFFYTAAKTYKQNQVVFFGGYLFVALQTTTGNAPSTSGDTDYWARVFTN